MPSYTAFATSETSALVGLISFSIDDNNSVATKNGNNFTVSIDTDKKGRPELDMVGEVIDQAYDIVWTEESDNLYKANIRSYAEDGTEVLNSKIENEGIPTKERRIEYSYDNGVVCITKAGSMKEFIGDDYLTIKTFKRKI